MPQNPIVTSPTPPYRNPPIRPDYYQPRRFVISSISRGVTTTITTTVDHDYVIGQWVRLLIPNKYGSRLLNEQIGLVISLPALNQVTVAIDSNGVDPFIPTPTFLPFESQTVPQIISVGDNNSGQINSNGRIRQLTYIPGSFINISPQ